MAEKDLVYFKQWIPAGHQMDKYSANPWCLFSKNVDIFSSSNSYKATAFTAATAQDSWIVDSDDRERIILKSNWDVVDTANNNTVIFNAITEFTAIWCNPKVDYVWPESNNFNHYSDAEFWTPKNIIVKYDWDNWTEIVVISDRTMFVKQETDVTRDIKYASWYWNGCTPVIDQDTNVIELTNITNKNFSVYINADTPWFCNAKMYVYRDNTGSSTWTLNWSQNNPVVFKRALMYYDAQTDSMKQYDSTGDSIYITPPALEEWTVKIFNVPVYNSTWWNTYYNHFIQFYFTLDTTDTVDSDHPRNWYVSIDIISRIEEYYTLLPQRDNRIVKNVWEYYFISDWGTFPSLWNFSSEWVQRNITISWESRTVKKALYTFVQYMWWEIDPAMDAVDCVVFDEKVYLICNQDWNWYIFPCDLSWGKWTPYIAYWVEFKSAIVLNYLIYLVWDNRGISTLFVYSWTELVHVIEGNEKNWKRDDYVNHSEQYKFNWMMADWRWKLVLWTSDNRIFCYWQTFWGRWWAFIHSLADWQTLTRIRTVWKDLQIKYTENSVVKTITYQDDTAVKNYNTQFEVVYPIILWNHIIEKEVYDLYCSYRLPSSDTKLEFWLSVNHNYFWSFKIPTAPTIEEWTEWSLWNMVEDDSYKLKFIEKNWLWYTFILEWDLPVQSAFNAIDRKIYRETEEDTEWVLPFLIEHPFTEYNHFKKIWEVTSDWYKEWFYRDYNITNKLWLPRTHSVQLMIRWIWTSNESPEVFWVSLDSNQRNRW